MSPSVVPPSVHAAAPTRLAPVLAEVVASARPAPAPGRSPLATRAASGGGGYASSDLVGDLAAERLERAGLHVEQR